MKAVSLALAANFMAAAITRQCWHQRRILRLPWAQEGAFPRYAVDFGVMSRSWRWKSGPAVVKRRALSEPDPRMRSRVEPLDPLTWVREVTCIRNDLRRPATDHQIDRLVRRSFYMAALAPDPVWFSTCPFQDEVELEAAFEDGGTSAAIALLISRHLACVSERSGDQMKFTVAAPLLGLTGSAAGQDADRAILEAWLNCFLPEEHDSRGNKVVNLSEHRTRSAWRPQSFER